jgi:prepilin-type N-terminal cleavage/methylation domain-containing protein
MKLPPPPLTRRIAAFTLIEVLVASAVLAIGLMGILLVCSTGIRNARALDRVHVDATSVAAELSLTNKLEEGFDSGDFGDFHPGYVWEREITQVMTNGLFRVDFSVWSAADRSATESKMTILLFRPDSPQKGFR